MTLNIDELSNAEIIEAFTLIGTNGDIIILKNDALRPQDRYTVVISSGNNKFASIRYDSDSLGNSVKKALTVYCNAMV